MAKQVITCHAQDGISQAEALMRDNRIRRLPVLDQNERLAGVISLNDIAREAQRERAGGHPEVNTEDLTETLASVSAPRAGRDVTIAA
jgi:CBS-domain-containing membrane protein